ncbi:CD2 antigen cytoplasmic tail-binding protein 2 isoform X1 [Punica granatum]|uniref:CD2 antigen cytoplasmic tail-binding protein 2 isoform X1 n=1 Tax=Punica granatum TaxID=22663 RepID=A0A218VSR8_PUNGR|nr:CD2 antigen cytoplasmic tail-binding protein 2 isoform X1 [Punica granatum]OWM63594.1 hypothetical protein CDL15_Pgr008137 [Punica granatum]
MEGSQSRTRSSRKRSFLEEDDDSHSNKPPAPKRVRFPKGKKVKPVDEGASKNLAPEEAGPVDLTNPRFASKERAKRRTQITADLLSEESRGALNDISAAEVTYEDNENFVDDGIQLEPFNLDKERQEGYFDAQGNFVEYVSEKEIKDAWLDSIEVDTKLASKIPVSTVTEDDKPELSSDDIGRIKRRIADSLLPGETVLQALRRLKGNSNNRKEKMSAETKHLFDQLTEDAAMLMEHGEYNVYHEQQEVFEREAEGYERLARARAGETDVIADGTKPAGTNGGLSSSILDDTAVEPSNPSVSTAQISTDGADEYDMFAEDENTATRPSSEGSNPVPRDTGAVGESGDSQGDYVYDEASGYYYSSSLGYYYDPSTGLYCSAATGQWYSFNEETGTYEEIPAEPVASNVT